MKDIFKRLARTKRWDDCPKHENSIIRARLKQSDHREWLLVDTKPILDAYFEYEHEEADNLRTGYDLLWEEGEDEIDSYFEDDWYKDDLWDIDWGAGGYWQDRQDEDY